MGPIRLRLNHGEHNPPHQEGSVELEHMHDGSKVTAAWSRLLRVGADLPKRMLDPRWRALTSLKLFARRQTHQTTYRTELDRYPEIFAACQKLLTGDERRLLSFGCATGEEVLSLRRYFPSATIVGAEINRHSLKVARSQKIDNRMSFVPPRIKLLKRAGPYDAIFCMAVLQRTPHLIDDNGINDIAKIYPFDKFDRQISEFDSLLIPGGLLVVEYSQYLVTEATVGSRYTPVRIAYNPEWSPGKFDRLGRRKAVAPPPLVVFRKE